MKSSRLCRNFLRNSMEHSLVLYNRKRIYPISLLQKSKNQYYKNFNVKEITDNKMFQKTIKPLLSGKLCIKDRISISEKGEILKTESKTAETFQILLRI